MPVCPVLSSGDYKLFQYFLANAPMMLRFHLYPKILFMHSPIESIFLPVAKSSSWCFETMVLLFSAYHRRNGRTLPQEQSQEAEDQDIAAMQNRVLKTARERISDIVERGESSDADLVAFLFLAVVDCRLGNKEIGLMHLNAWQRYLVMRREHNVPPCGSVCKVIVWWCVSMLLWPEAPLPSVLDESIVHRIQRDPEKLFRCLDEESLSGFENM